MHLFATEVLLRTCGRAVRISFAAATLIILGCSQHVPNPVSVDENAANVGEVWSCDVLDVVLPVFNVTDRYVTISRFEKSCECIEIHPIPLQLAPKERSQVHLTIAIPPSARPEVITQQLRPVVDGFGNDQPTWEITAVVRPFLLLDSTIFDVGEVVMGDDIPEVVISGRLAAATESISVRGPPNVLMSEVILSEDGMCFSLRQR